MPMRPNELNGAGMTGAPRTPTAPAAGTMNGMRTPQAAPQGAGAPPTPPQQNGAASPLAQLSREELEQLAMSLIEENDQLRQMAAQAGPQGGAPPAGAGAGAAPPPTPTAGAAGMPMAGAQAPAPSPSPQRTPRQPMMR